MFQWGETMVKFTTDPSSRVSNDFYYRPPYEIEDHRADDPQKHRDKFNKLTKKFSEDYHTVQELGKGASGNVTLAKHKYIVDDEQEEVVVKSLHYDIKDKRKNNPATLTEFNMATGRRAGHGSSDDSQVQKASESTKIPSQRFLNIEKSFDSRIAMHRSDRPLEMSKIETADGIEEAFLYMYMDKAEGKSLDNLLEDGNESFTTPINALQIAYQLASGLEDLHNYNLIHGDIKPANIILDQKDNQELSLKISDPGLIVPVTNEVDKSTSFKSMGKSDQDYSGLMGDPNYIDIHSQKNHITSQAGDITAWALILLKLLTGLDRQSLLGISKNADNPAMLTLFNMLRQPQTDLKLLELLKEAYPNNSDKPGAAIVHQLIPLIEKALDQDFKARPSAESIRRTLEKTLKENGLEYQIRQKLLTDVKIGDMANIATDELKQLSQSSSKRPILATQLNELIKNINLTSDKTGKNKKIAEFTKWLDLQILRPKYASASYNLQQYIKQTLGTKFFDHELKKNQTRKTNKEPQLPLIKVREIAELRANNLARREADNATNNLKSIAKLDKGTYNLSNYFNFVKTLDKYSKYHKLALALNNEITMLEKLLPPEYFKNNSNNSSIKELALEKLNWIGNQSLESLKEKQCDIGEDISIETISKTLSHNNNIMGNLTKIAQNKEKYELDSFKIKQIQEYLKLKINFVNNSKHSISSQIAARVEHLPEVEKYINNIKALAQLVNEQKIETKNIGKLYQTVNKTKSSITQRGFDSSLHKLLLKIIKEYNGKPPEQLPLHICSKEFFFDLSKEKDKSKLSSFSIEDLEQFEQLKKNNEILKDLVKRATEYYA